MKTASHQCPSCTKNFTALDKHTYGNFCPHCHIQLFKQASPSFSQSLTVNQQVFANFINSVIVTSFCCLLIIFAIVYGLYDFYQVYKPYAILIVVVTVLAFLGYSYYKNKQQPQLFIAGVDSLADYQADNCDYKINPVSVEKCQCPQCHSYRMTDLFFFKRRTALTVHIVHDNKEDNFVGCLNCQAQYIIRPSIKNQHNRFIWLWSIMYIGVIIALYFAITYVIDIPNVALYCVIIGYNFISSLVPLHQHKSVSTLYTEITKKEP